MQIQITYIATLTKRLKLIVGIYFVTSVKIGELNYFLMIYSNYFYGYNVYNMRNIDLTINS